MAVTVTESAAREVASIIKQQDLDPQTTHLRVGVKGGGCSGFSYLLDLTENQRDSDEVWEYEFALDGAEHDDAKDEPDTPAAEGNVTVDVRIICDPKSYMYLNGTVIDFKDEIMGRGFVFSNPNASSTCGCGSSFAV